MTNANAADKFLIGEVKVIMRSARLDVPVGGFVFRHPNSTDPTTCIKRRGMLFVNE